MDTYQLDIRIPLEDSVRKILFSRLRSIDQDITAQKDIHRIIHEARRSIKRIRALLRMIRYEIGYSHYFRENRFYRDLARTMAPLRDSFVLHSTLEKLSEEHPEMIEGKLLDDLKENLSGRLGEVISRFRDEQDGVRALQEGIRKARERIDGFCQLRHRFPSVGRGIRKTYLRSRKQASGLDPIIRPEVFHEYRKEAKYLQYQLEIIQPLYPKMIKAFTGTLSKHTEMLGDARDLDRFITFLEHSLPSGAGDNILQETRHHLEFRRGIMLEKVCNKAKLIYAEKPGQFADRIGVYWENRYHLN